MTITIFLVSILIILLNLMNLHTAIQFNETKVAARISFVLGLYVCAIIILTVLKF